MSARHGLAPIDASRRRLAVGALVVAVMTLVASCAAATPALTLNVDAAAQAIPEARLSSIDAAGFESILVGLRGTPVVVNIWASWCPPCRAEAPLLQRAADHYGEDVVFLGIAAEDRRDDAREFLDRFEIVYPNVLDNSGEVTTLLEMSGFPTTYVFGRDGDLRAKVTGGVSERQLAAVVDDALRS